VQVIRAFVHALVLTVARATDMPTSIVVLVQVQLVQRVGAHAQDEGITRICDRALARSVVVVKAKPNPRRTLLESHPQVARKRRKWGLGNVLDRRLARRVMKVGALDFVAGHRCPCN